MTPPPPPPSTGAVEDDATHVRSKKQHYDQEEATQQIVQAAFNAAREEADRLAKEGRSPYPFRIRIIVEEDK